VRWLSLLRVSLLPSALADPLAGLVLACQGFPADARAVWLLAASAGVYHGGLVLNDWSDRAHDARTRPARPIPSGAVRPAAALALGLALVLLGLGASALAGGLALAWMAGVALLALGYDLGLRGRLAGPALLGLCRAGNLALGIAWAVGAGEARPSVALVVAPLLYGAYVFAVSRLARLEDGEELLTGRARPRARLQVAAALLACAALLPALASPAAFSGLALLGLHSEPVLALALGLPALIGAYGLWRRARELPRWERADVERAVGQALRRLPAFTATVALCAVPRAGWEALLAAACIVAGWPFGAALRRAFPPS
jgi:4-hydroxybenzoate polyprenyltransferase